MILNEDHLNQDGLEIIRNLSKQINIITSQTRKTGNLIIKHRNNINKLNNK